MNELWHAFITSPIVATIVGCIVFVAWSAVWRGAGLWLDGLKPANPILAKLVSVASTIAHLLATRTPPKTIDEAKQDAVEAAKSAVKTAGVVVLLFVALSTTACSAPNPACSPQSLAAIEEGYISEVYFACRGYQGDPEWRTKCTEYPAIAEKYRQQRDAWVRCQ